MNKDVEPHYRFQNLQENNMTFEQVFAHIIKFMHRQPAGKYNLMVRTDCQYHDKQILCITGIVIRYKGQVVCECMRKVISTRQMLRLHERICYEKRLSAEILDLSAMERRSKLMDIVLPNIYHSAS